MGCWVRWVLVLMNKSEDSTTLSASREAAIYICASEHQLHPAFLGDSPRSAGRSDLGSSQITAFALVSEACELFVHPLRVRSLVPSALWVSRNYCFCPESHSVWDFVCRLRVKSLLPSALWVPRKQAFLAFKAKCCKGSFSWCMIPGLGSLMWGSDFSLLGKASAI